MAVASFGIVARSAALIRSSREALLSLLHQDDFGGKPEDSHRALALVRRIVTLSAAGGHNCNAEIRALRAFEEIEKHLAATTPSEPDGPTLSPAVMRLAEKLRREEKLAYPSDAQSP